MVPKECGFNQSVAATACAHAKRDVIHTRLPWKVMVKLYKYSIWVIPCQINQWFASHPSDSDEIWHTCR